MAKKSHNDTRESRPRISRRGFLVSTGVGVGSFAAGVGTASAVASAQLTSSKPSQTVPFYGVHQAGIDTSIQSQLCFQGWNLKPGTDKDAARRMMRLLTDDAARLTQGQPALPDNDPYLADNPERLTITFGFGPSFFKKLGLDGYLPEGFGELPAFSIDELQPEYSGGDVLIQMGSDDPLTLSHAMRQMTRTARSFATIVWSQLGFTRDQSLASSQETPRNLFGQKDGTVNPRTPEEFDQQVWASGSPQWFEGGTTMVLRRIEMNLDTWDTLDEGGKELAIGRKLESGAPLTGTQEFDPPDFEARAENGLPIIPSFSHMRRARVGGPRQQFLRRGANYDEGIKPDGTPNVGLLFAAYMANMEQQFVPVQQRLADLDILNTWTTPIGSAVFALPPGCQPGGYIGEGLLSS